MYESKTQDDTVFCVNGHDKISRPKIQNKGVDNIIK